MTNLYKKIHAVMCESEGIEKNMEVGFGANKYKAVSESSVLNEIKPLLKKHNLIIIPEIVEESKEFQEATRKDGSVVINVFTTVTVTWRIADVDSGENRTLQSIGYGVDTQDKGSGKAMTYAYKMLLQKTFCLFSGEDTDNTHSSELVKRIIATEAELKKDTSTERKPSEPQIKRLYTIAKSRGFSEAQIKTAIIKELGKQSAKDLTVAEYDHLIKRIEAKPPVENE